MLLRAKNYHLHAFNMFVVEKACINSISTLDRFLQYNLTVDYIESFQPLKKLMMEIKGLKVYLKEL